MKEKTLPIAALIGVLLSIPSSIQATARDAQKYYQQGDYERAAKHYHEAAEGDPTDARLHYNLGASLYRQDDYQGAAEAFQQALKTRDVPVQQKAFYSLGVTLYQLGRHDLQTNPHKTLTTWENALKQLKNARELNPSDEDATHNYEIVKNQTEALKQTLDAQPKNPAHSKSPTETKNQSPQKDSEPPSQQTEAPQKSAQNATNSPQTSPPSNDPAQEHHTQASSTHQKPNTTKAYHPDEERAHPQQPSDSDSKSSKTSATSLSNGKDLAEHSETAGTSATPEKEEKNSESPPPSATAEPQATDSNKPNPSHTKASDPASEAESASSPPIDAGRMSREEAQQLLESLRSSEKKLPFSSLIQKPKQTHRYPKDW